MPKNKLKTWQEVAREFHDTYEQLASKFGYKTRPDTKEFDPKSPNGKLMIAVCKEVISKQIDKAREEVVSEITEKRVAGLLKSGYNAHLEFTPKRFGSIAKRITKGLKGAILDKLKTK